MDTNRLKRFATEARNILMRGVVHRLTALGFLPDGSVTEEPQQQGGGATFMGDTVTQDFYNKWQSLRRAVSERKIEEVAEEAAYTWFNRLVAIRIMVKNGLASPVLEYESDDILIPILVSEARQGRIPQMDDDSMRKLTALLDDDSKTNEQFALLIVAYCHTNPVINNCFGHISDYTELLLPANILTEGGFVHMLNNTEFISEDDFKSPELIGWLYQFYISEKKDDVFASFKKGKKAEAKDIPAATQIFTPNWIVKYMVQNTVGRIYLDNNPYSNIKESMQYLVEPEEPTPSDAIFRFDDIHDLTCADLTCGSGHILNECFDLLYQLYIEEGYSRKKAIEDIFKYNLTGVDLDTRAKQLAQFALLLKACQKDPSFADAHCMPKVLDMPKPYDAESVSMSLDSACIKFMGGYETVAGEMLEQDMELLMDANNLGSIMQFNDDEDYLAMLQYHYDDWTDSGIDDCPEEIQALIPGVELILTLTKKYAALVMNPPYMRAANMNDSLHEYVNVNYSTAPFDLYSVFMLKAMDSIKENGINALIVQTTWLANYSFGELREKIVDNFHISSLLHMGRGNFGNDWGSCAFVLRNGVSDHESIFFKLYERTFYRIEPEHIAELFLASKQNEQLRFDFRNYSSSSFSSNHVDNGRRIVYRCNQNKFKRVENTPFCYTFNDDIIDIINGDNVGTFYHPTTGLQSGGNDQFVRNWNEVSYNKFHQKWFPYVNGGNARRWYGNFDCVVNWENDGYEIKHIYNPNGRLKSRPQSQQYYFKEGITWNRITSKGVTLRYLPSGCIFDQAGDSMFTIGENNLYTALGYLNTYVAKSFFEMLAPTINLTAGTIKKIPFKDCNPNIEIVKENISISRQDWDAHETSWDFVRNELLTMDENVLFDNINYQAEQHFNKTGEHICIDPAPPMPESVEWCYDMYCGKWERMFMQLHENEEELNRQFIEIYGLQDELTPDVPLDEITILQQGEVSINENANDDDDRLIWHSDVVMKQLISYAAGCMMGRYSIDAPGLILANQGDGQNEYNAKVPNSRFEVDDDGIIPLMASDTDFADNATLRFKQWLTVAFGDEKLVENLNFIEGALGKSLDDYFVKDFWKDHKKMYQNRPIYWLFSSKKGAFQCIAYMHRMNAYTAERIRTKYLLPHIEWLMQKQSEMEENAANLSTAERKKLDSIRKQIDECREYHDRLHVVADEQIAFDLDDGVVVNYAKFGDVLAKLK